MKIEECKHRIKCDFEGCKNLAKYSFSTRGILRRELAFCEDCMKGMFECFSKISVPKAVETPFKLNKRLKRSKNEKTE